MPPVVTVFRSRLRPEAIEAYEPEAERIENLARAQPGFVEVKGFVADDGERVSLVTFTDRPSHDAWRDHPEHRAAQARGRAEFYAEYCIQVCDAPVTRSFRQGDAEAHTA